MFRFIVRFFERRKAEAERRKAERKARVLRHCDKILGAAFDQKPQPWTVEEILAREG